MDVLMRGVRSPFSWFLLALLTTAGLTAIGPQEALLGEQVRVVYLHGAWELSAEIIFGLAALAGFFGLLFRSLRLQRWSSALGHTGISFWVIALPLSMWAMQTSWQGLYLGEPRFRLVVIFAVTGILLQIGLALLARHAWTSLGNVLFFTALWIMLHRVDLVLHPVSSPIFTSTVFR